MGRDRTAGSQDQPGARDATGAPPDGPSRLTLARLAVYHEIARRELLHGRSTLTSALMALETGVSDGLVRRDMASVGINGRAHIGYSVTETAARLDELFALGEHGNAILIGCGALGSAIARAAEAGRFDRFGLRLVAVFDVSPEKIGRRVGAHPVRPIQECKDVVRVMEVDIAVLAVPTAVAQEIADWLAHNRVKAIWNFAPVHLRLPRHVAIRNEHLSTGLIQLLHCAKRGRASATAK